MSIVADGDYVAVHWHYAEDVNDEFTGSGEENKTTVTEFYVDLFNNRNLDLIEELVDPSYLQHNHWVPNGSGALFGFVSGGVLPVAIFLTLAEGDMVWTFMGTGKRNLFTVDLWRVDNNINKIVEHWDM